MNFPYMVEVGAQYYHILSAQLAKRLLTSLGVQVPGSMKYQ